jgi:hypothetical protein
MITTLSKLNQIMERLVLNELSSASENRTYLMTKETENKTKVTDAITNDTVTNDKFDYHTITKLSKVNKVIRQNVMDHLRYINTIRHADMQAACTWLNDVGNSIIIKMENENLATSLRIKTEIPDSLWRINTDEYVHTGKERFAGHIQNKQHEGFEITIFTFPDELEAPWAIIETINHIPNIQHLHNTIINAKWGSDSSIRKNGIQDPNFTLKFFNDLGKWKSLSNTDMIRIINPKQETIESEATKIQIWLSDAFKRITTSNAEGQKHISDAYVSRINDECTEFQIGFHHGLDGEFSPTKVQGLIQFDKDLCSRAFFWVFFDDNSDGFKDVWHIKTEDDFIDLMVNTDWSNNSLLDIHYKSREG